MQWDNGLPAQHMDIDLSCCIAYNNTDFFYYNIVATNCKLNADATEQKPKSLSKTKGFFIS